MIPTLAQDTAIIGIAELLKKIGSDDMSAYSTAYFSVMNEWPQEIIPLPEPKPDYKTYLIFGLGIAVLVLFLTHKK